MRRKMALVLALTFLLSACGGGEVPRTTLSPLPTYEGPTLSPTYESPPPTQVNETVTPGSISSRQAVCESEGEEYGLAVVTTSIAEIQYLTKWDVCQSTSNDGSFNTWLRNNTDAVWVLSGVMQSETSDFKRSANFRDAVRAPSFRAAAAKESPGMVILNPGESVRIARSPEQVRWDLDLPLTLAWSSQGALIDKIEEKVPGIALEVFTPETSIYRAVFACTFSVIDHARRFPKLDEADGAEIFMQGLVSANGAVDCASEAEDAKILLRDGRTSTVKSAIIKALPEDSQVLSQVESKLAPYQQLIRKGAFRLATRGKSG